MVWIVENKILNFLLIMIMKVSGITFHFLLASLFVCLCLQFVKCYDDVPRLSAALLWAVARVMCEQQQQVEDQVRIIPA